MHHFEGENAKIFLGPSPDPSPTGEGDTPSPDPIPVDAFGASIRVPSVLDPQAPLFTFLNTPLHVKAEQLKKKTEHHLTRTRT